MIETAREQRIRERRRIVIALAISVLVHVLLLGVALLVLVISAVMRPPSEPEPEVDTEPVELIFLSPPEPKEERGFIDSAQTEVSEEVPENAQFESDENSRAASERPPVSDENTPSVDGERDDGLTLRNQELALGPSKRPSPPAPPPQEQRPAVEEQPPQPHEEQQREEPTPTPAPTPSKNDLAVPAPPKPRKEPEVRKPEPPTPPAVPRTPGYQPQTRTTRLTGGISNRGRASVDAVATPLGRYRKMLNDAIGSRWYYYVSDMIGLVNVGAVHITFTVRADGKVEKVRVTRNTSNESLASCSMRSIIEAEIPPIPREIAETLEGGKLEVDFSFTIVP